MNDAAAQLRNAPRRILPWLVLLFLGSGCAALVYEVVWFQLLQLAVGLTTVSLGVLLGAYMGGMCLGSWFLPRVLTPRCHPLRVYACLELGIAICGVGILFFMPTISNVYAASAGRGFSGVLLRGVVAGLCLVPPTILMGATLPAMARWVESTPTGVSWLGFFYGGNIAGAMFGCLLAGFYLLRVHDTGVATYVAASLNTVVALAAFAIAAHTGSHEPSRELPVASSTAPTGPGSRTVGVYVAIGLSGLAALGAEVVWTRLLSLVLGGTVYTFSIILAVFLLGLGLGSSLGAMLARGRGSAVLWFGACQLLLVGATAWTGAIITQSLPYWPINPALAPSPWFTFQLDLARCLWALLPAPVLWGASFPLALRAAGRVGVDPGRLVGSTYAANTVGAIVGALVFSLWIVPTFGTQWAERILIGIPILAAAVLLFGAADERREALETVGTEEPVPQAWRPAAVIGLVAGAVAAIWLAVAAAPVPWGVVAYGRYMATYENRLAPGIVPESAVPTSGTPDIFCTYLGEGLNGSIAVTKWTTGVRNFHSAGKVQASSDRRDMRLQRMLGHLSALLHQRPESVLVVACGAGVTAGTFVLHPEVQRIVICDIEPLVPQQVAPLFAHENYDVVKDARTEVVADDGRHFIRTTPEKFDIITSDPIDPWVKGCAALNTVEYYEACKAHLKPGGLVSLWLPLYESNSDTAKSLIATFFKVFPGGILWSNDSDDGGYDAVLLGQAEPGPIDVDALQRRLDRPDHSRVKRSLADVGFRSVVDLLATYAGSSADLRGWVRDAQINTDRNLRLQYLAGLSFNSYQGANLLREIGRFYRFPDQLFVGSNLSTNLLKARRRLFDPAFP